MTKEEKIQYINARCKENDEISEELKKWIAKDGIDKVVDKLTYLFEEDDRIR